ncbi:MAG TPA: hypothetical protein VJ739_11440, partial [Gemmataceae bacterium]|nr:hypothetical protein [Gemmataceae bacterium]
QVYLAQCQVAAGKLEAAQKKLQELLEARLLIHTGKAAEAAAKLEQMARGLSASDPEAAKVQVYLAQCQVAAGKLEAAQKKLQELLAGNLDPADRGLVYNALGDVCRESKQPEEAFWDYLWVDVVYNQDKQEQAKALYWLSKLFVEVKNDPARAQECRKRLLEGKDFLGMEYQKRAARDKGE